MCPKIEETMGSSFLTGVLIRLTYESDGKNSSGKYSDFLDRK